MKIDFRKNSKSLWASWILIMMFLVTCVAFPLLLVLLSAGAEDFKTVASSGIWHQAMKNTFRECICSSSLSVLIGYIFAYAVAKGNIPAKRFFEKIPLIHLVTPPFVGGLAFILLIGRQGFITHNLLGLDISLYGFPGLLIAQSLCFFPLAYMICIQSLNGINPNLEQAARSMGAGNFRIFCTVTLPLSAPGILSSFLFIAVNVLSDFGNPLIVAGRYRVLAVEIYTQLTGWLNIGVSAVLGIVLVVPSVALFLIQNKVLKGMAPKISSIGGKSASELPQNQKRGKFVTILLTVFVAFISLCVLAQFAAIIAGSFQKLWGINTTFTFDHIKAVFSGRYFRGLKNSVGFSLAGAFFSTIIASFAAYIVHRTHAPLRKSMDTLVQLPSAIPGSLLGLAILIASQRIHFKNSPVLIVIAMTVAFMPFSYRVISQGFAQIRTTLDDGARSLGANPVRTLCTVLIPVASSSVFSGFIYDFIRGVGTLSAVIFLVSFKTPLTSINIVNLAEQGNWGTSAALALVLTVITFVTLGVGNLLLFFRRKKGSK